jgi:hypothetical protein
VADAVGEFITVPDSLSSAIANQAAIDAQKSHRPLFTYFSKLICSSVEFQSMICTGTP